MTFSSLRRIGRDVTLALALVCLASCAVPLTPGYQVEKESITVRFIPGTPPHLAVRARYRLANIGTAPLGSVELGLPNEKGFGLANLRVKIDGREVTPQRESSETPALAEGESAVSEIWPETWRIPFESRWSRREHRNLEVEYDLAETAATDPRMSIGPNGFYLNDSGWFPEPISAKALFAKNVVRPDPSDLLVALPANFVATASGQLRGTRKAAKGTEFRFRLHKDDFDPYVVAGQYHRERMSDSGVNVELWTMKPLSASDARAAASRLAATYQFYVAAFGPLPGNTVKVIESRGDENPGTGLWQIFIFPPPQIVFSQVPVSVTDNVGEPFPSPNIKRALAWSWFGHATTPRPGAWLLARGIAAYAMALVYNSSPSGNVRTDNVVSLLDSYDQARLKTVEKPIINLSHADPWGQIQMGTNKTTLFLFALEDRCGRENVEHALAHMVYALRGQEYGYTDFHAALEEECHQDLSSMFATWLDQEGIPSDFRVRYESKNKSAN